MLFVITPLLAFLSTPPEEAQNGPAREARFRPGTSMVGSDPGESWDWHYAVPYECIDSYESAGDVCDPGRHFVSKSDYINVLYELDYWKQQYTYQQQQHEYEMYMANMGR